MASEQMRGLTMLGDRTAQVRSFPLPPVGPGAAAR